MAGGGLRAIRPRGCFVSLCLRSGDQLQRWRSRAIRNDVVPPAGTGGQDAVVADVVEARRRDAGRQAFQKRDRLEQDVGGAVSPAVLEAVAEACIVELGEPLRGQWGTG